jgi:hypothetical protein
MPDWDESCRSNTISIERFFAHCHPEESRQWRDDEESHKVAATQEILGGVYPLDRLRAGSELVEGLRITCLALPVVVASSRMAQFKYQKY